MFSVRSSGISTAPARHSRTGLREDLHIVLRPLNLLLIERAEANQIVLCTFTEKAAFEMRDRLAAAARHIGYGGDLSQLTASTIHIFCNRVLEQHRHRTELGHSYDTLDELTQLLFIFEHFDEVIVATDCEDAARKAG